jgi:4-amino-4-deoxy-L-arabinose transferase-like glycosyltransferase
VILPKGFQASAFDVAARSLRWLLLAAGVLYVAGYVSVALGRMDYPFELEWLEGNSLVQVQRILAGEKLYVPPSLAFTDYIYPPVYFYASAAASYFIGGGFLPLRLVSFLASLGCLAVIFDMLRRETGSRFAAFAGASLFAATFRIAGAFFDVARVDMLCLLFLLIGFWALRRRTTVSCVVGALCFTLAFFTKQTVLIGLLPVAAGYWIIDRRRALVATATGLGAALVSIWTIDRIHDGWYSFFAFTLSGRHRVLYGLEGLYRVTRMFVQDDLLRPFGIAVILSAFYFLFTRRVSSEWRTPCSTPRLEPAWSPWPGRGG